MIAETILAAMLMVTPTVLEVVEPNQQINVRVGYPITSTTDTPGVTEPLTDLRWIQVQLEREDIPGSGEFALGDVVAIAQLPDSLADGIDDGTGERGFSVFSFLVTEWLPAYEYRVVARAGDMTLPTNWSVYTEPAVNLAGEPVTMILAEEEPPPPPEDIYPPSPPEELTIYIPPLGE